MSLKCVSNSGYFATVINKGYFVSTTTLLPKSEISSL